MNTAEGVRGGARLGVAGPGLDAVDTSPGGGKDDKPSLYHFPALSLTLRSRDKQQQKVQLLIEGKLIEGVNCISFWSVFLVALLFGRETRDNQKQQKMK